jgi:hypothetical protein
LFLPGCLPVYQAGLFSAVVTAFVLESYKSLQPDPNDTIINLLSQIANGPNITSSFHVSTRSAIPLVSSFVQSPSSVRINVFWFISLILSLTTVLVGTIAIQWLREHQSYPGVSPKETLAILHMRSESLEAWYVPQIFSTLPLLLQGALVLFFAGLIDFTLPLGTKLTAPVACIIGLILLFLAATTALPAFQSLFLFSGHFSRDAVPTPCAFKSPQSQVFRTLFGFFLHLLSFAFPTVYLPEKQFKDLTWNIFSKDSSQHNHFPYMYTIWYQKTWPTFDFEWLSLRDAWHNGILDKDTELYEHLKEWKGAFPLSDITQCLVKAITEPTSGKHTEDFLVAACYCFQEVSASIWKNESLNYGDSDQVDRRNHYFEQLYQRRHDDWYATCSIAQLLVYGGTYGYDESPNLKFFYLSDYLQEHRDLFHQDQILWFSDMLLEHHTSPALDRYQVEIRSRTMQYLLKHNITPLTPIPNINDFNLLPLLEFDEEVTFYARRERTDMNACGEPFV